MDESHIGKTTEDKPQLEFVSKNEKQADLTLDDKGSFEQNFDFCFWLTVSLFFFFFKWLFGSPTANFGPFSWGDSLTNPMLITAFSICSTQRSLGAS